MAWCGGRQESTGAGGEDEVVVGEGSEGGRGWWWGNCEGFALGRKGEGGGGEVVG